MSLGLPTRSAGESSRDLHDGAQQGLIALRIQLQLLEELVAEDPNAVAPGLADASERVDKTIDHIRNLAKGIYPSALRDLGLAPALAAVVRDLPIHAAIRTDLSRRYPPHVEAAVYFCCVEALQNVAKHCEPETNVELLAIERPQGLEFAVADDGRGFETAIINNSRGLTGLRDRLEAIGGKLTIESEPDRGTTVTGRVPAGLL